jgi:RNA polymerase sigma-70 factor (ECF subfamily)
MADASSGLLTRLSLLLRVRDPADVDAWEVFVDVYGPMVYAHCRGKGLTHEDAEDVTQNVFARVLQSIRTFEYKRELGRFRDWLGTIVRHEIHRFLHKNRPQAGRGGDGPDDPIRLVEAREEETSWASDFNAHILQRALSRCQPHFRPDTWRAFSRVWIENCPVPDVAREMDRTIDWVYIAKSRVLKRLWHEVLELAADTAWFSQA